VVGRLAVGRLAVGRLAFDGAEVVEFEHDKSLPKFVSNE